MGDKDRVLKRTWQTEMKTQQIMNECFEPINICNFWRRVRIWPHTPMLNLQDRCISRKLKQPLLSSSLTNLHDALRIESCMPWDGFYVFFDWFGLARTPIMTQHEKNMKRTCRERNENVAEHAARSPRANPDPGGSHYASRNFTLISCFFDVFFSCFCLKSVGKMLKTSNICWLRTPTTRVGKRDNNSRQNTYTPCPCFRARGRWGGVGRCVQTTCFRRFRKQQNSKFCEFFQTLPYAS